MACTQSIDEKENTKLSSSTNKTKKKTSFKIASSAMSHQAASEIFGVVLMSFEFFDFGLQIHSNISSKLQWWNSENARKLDLIEK
jgi:hypothetical protein